MNECPLQIKVSDRNEVCSRCELIEFDASFIYTKDYNSNISTADKCLCRLMILRLT
jgi:hypothetical protein